MSAAVVAADLRAVQLYLQGGVHGQDQQQQHCDQWCARLSALRISAGDAVLIQTELGQGPWSGAQRQALNQALSSAVLAAAAGPTQRRGLQSCNNWMAYFSQKDIQVLQSDNSLHYKVDVIASRLCRVGLHCPAETTLAGCLAVAQTVGLALPETPEARYGCIQALKKTLKSKILRARRPAVHLLVYPQSPQELPADLLTPAYDADDPPCGRSNDPAAIPSGNIPLRRSNVNLKKQSFVDQTVGPFSANPSDGYGNLMINMMQMVNSMIQHQAGGGEANLQLFKPKAKKQPLALGDAPEEPASAPVATPARAQAATPADPAPATVGALPASATVPVLPEAATVPALPEPEPAVLPALLDIPEMSAEEQAALVNNAIENRKDSKPQPKAKAKAKAKAKSKAVAKCKAQFKPKSILKTSMAKAKASPKGKAQAKPKIKPKKNVKNSQPLVDFYVNGKLLTAAFRRSKYPNGCGKCRERVGCTAPCWKSRRFWFRVGICWLVMAVCGCRMGNIL